MQTYFLKVQEFHNRCKLLWPNIIAFCFLHMYSGTVQYPCEVVRWVYIVEINTEIAHVTS